MQALLLSYHLSCPFNKTSINLRFLRFGRCRFAKFDDSPAAFVNLMDQGEGILNYTYI